jgi:hypothetical protein
MLLCMYCMVLGERIVLQVCLLVCQYGKSGVPRLALRSLPPRAMKCFSACHPLPSQMGCWLSGQRMTKLGWLFRRIRAEERFFLAYEHADGQSHGRSQIAARKPTWKLSLSNPPVISLARERAWDSQSINKLPSAPACHGSPALPATAGASSGTCSDGGPDWGAPRNSPQP